MGFVSKFLIPSLATLVVHAVIFAALTVGWEVTPTPKRVKPPTYIEAKLVQLETKSQKKASAKKKPRKIDLTAKRKEQERLKREAKRKAEAKKQATLKAEKQAALKKKKQAEAEATRLRDAQEKRKLEQERRLQQEFEEALAAEQGMLAEEEYAAEAESYRSRIRKRIESNWSRPPSARTGMRCVLSIQLVPTGRIVNVEVRESSGNAAFDRSAMQAVKKVEVFPEIKEMKLAVFERYYRKFSLGFSPQDLRL